MSYSYPYKSSLRKELAQFKAGLDYQIWQTSDLANLTANIHKPVIEIGGPTQDGFFYLEGVTFNSKPEITNISRNPSPYNSDYQKLATQVSAQMDATDMSYDDSSVGVFLMSAMSISSDWWVELDEEEKNRQKVIFEKESKIARFEMGQVAMGHLEPIDVTHAQRIMIFSEIQRCLCKDGLLFSDGGIEEIVILQKMGFEIIACLQFAEEYGLSYEFVAKKSSI